MNQTDQVTENNRRAFLRRGSLGIGGLAAAWMLNQDAASAKPPMVGLEQRAFDLSPKQPDFEPRAKAMISLFQHGGPSHMDLTDPKPELTKYDGTEYKGDVAYSFVNAASKKLMGTRWKFRPRGQCGMELSELLPENRLEKDSIILRLRRDIISRLTLSESTSGFVVTISLTNDYAARIRPGRIDAALAEALSKFFEHGDPQANMIDVPTQIQDTVKHISVFRENMTDDPRLEDDREPLIVFGAQSTMLIPEDDCPAIVETRLSRKGLHDQTIPTWLLLWSNHHSLAPLRDEMDKAIGSYLRTRPIPYERIFHLHLYPQSGATEFPNPTPTNGV